jgi:hypothetical protein
MQLRSAATNKRATIEVRYPTLAPKHSKTWPSSLDRTKGPMNPTHFLGFLSERNDPTPTQVWHSKKMT